MLAPAITTGMEEGDYVASCRVERADVAAFVAITVGAGKTKVPLRRWPIVFFCVNVINFVGEEGITLVQPAVLAVAAGTLSDKTPQSFRYVRHTPLASFSRARILRRRTNCSSWR